jgi:hypothetical protein
VKRGEGLKKEETKGDTMNTVCKVPAGSQRNFQESLPGKLEKVMVMQSSPGTNHMRKYRQKKLR